MSVTIGRPVAPPAVPIAPGPVGGRRYAVIGELGTESGERLDSVTMAYETWGS